MGQIIENIGNISGKMLLFGGVYSNLQALEALKQIAEKENILPENCISTGDLVGYCAQPEETVELFKLWGAKSIVGNVEIQLRENAEDCGCDFREGSRCDDFSQQWYPYAQSKLSENSLDFLKTLPNHINFNYANKSVTVVHGSYFNVSEFIFKSTDWYNKKTNFEATKSDVIIAGHCGLPFHHQEENKIWLNPGVIGMPANDGSPNVWYVILNDWQESFKFTHHTLAYNYKLTSRLMRNGLLPKEYARTIVTGIWDNTEILPAFESGLQGFGIQL
ncbi:diadenosine tetraphosphatase [Polaribacter reichenbachii]|uniref:Diadenosine tetraphosphatase n=1 Tax=Polaribacter reichenbachii TaxID=996801 RepID=A0A1B8U704_9FLAO|nr:metallophosphoesterase family protein [Polaribacter reichenbachii]APZ46249.1 diadenosine tetraphosphatase [Polaribacter reichenbachii]AUC20111.1 diadenosine tetraphosphatase [Polaribacter reichenbachii]OBY67630.1 diadenosine tetraphosphatase [Polaribacter reichenbachii]